MRFSFLFHFSSISPTFANVLLPPAPLLQFQVFHTPQPQQLQPPQQQQHFAAPTSGAAAGPFTAPFGPPCLRLPFLPTLGKKKTYLFCKHQLMTSHVAPPILWKLEHFTNRKPSNIYFVQCLGKSTEWHLMNNYCKLCLSRSLCSSVTSTLFTPHSFQLAEGLSYQKPFSRV